MERHRCKLCNKNFSNGRALGGHMRSHLATYPLPLKKNQTESDSSSSNSSHHSTRDNREDINAAKAGFYELRENPRKSSKASYDAKSSIVLQDGQSDAESTQYPTRRRSKRSVRVGSGSKWVGSESPTDDQSTQLSSVSDDLASQDEEVARSLMMLSRDAWVVEKSVQQRPSSSTRVAKFKCGSCNKVFRTSRALEGHKQCCQQSNSTHLVGRKIFECPFCYKVFGSGQALGGHKRSHLILLGSSSTNNNNNKNKNVVDVIVASNNIMTNTTSCSNDDKVGDSTSSACFILDLNLPPPLEIDEDFVA